MHWPRQQSKGFTLPICHTGGAVSCSVWDTVKFEYIAKAKKKKTKLSVYWKYCKIKKLNFLCPSSNLAEDFELNQIFRTMQQLNADPKLTDSNCNNVASSPNTKFQTSRQASNKPRPISKNWSNPEVWRLNYPYTVTTQKCRIHTDEAVIARSTKQQWFGYAMLQQRHMGEPHHHTRPL